MSSNREIAEIMSTANGLADILATERAAHEETKRQLEEMTRSRDGWQADALTYAKSRECQQEMTERAERQLEIAQMHGCACDWSEGVPGPKTRPADTECDYHAGVRRQLERMRGLLKVASVWVPMSAVKLHDQISAALEER